MYWLHFRSTAKTTSDRAGKNRARIYKISARSDLKQWVGLGTWPTLRWGYYSIAADTSYKHLSNASVVTKGRNAKIKNGDYNNRAFGRFQRARGVKAEVKRHWSGAI